MTTTTEPETTTALILTGAGYELTISPDALAKKQDLILLASDVSHVDDNEESAIAQRHVRNLAALRILTEKSRKEVKEPVNRIGKMIDKTAKDFIESVELEEKRIARLIGSHAEAVAAERRRLEAEERRKAEESRLAREAAERAAEEAANKRTIANIIAAKKAAEARLPALAERMKAAEETASAKVSSSVRFTWDFEVEDIHLLYAIETGLVDLTPRRSAILAAIKELDDEGLDVEIPGLRIFKKPVVSTR